jgi:hypothetical protein
MKYPFETKREVVLWSGGLDSTVLLHQLALKSKSNPVIALSISDHMGARHQQFVRQARARKNYLRFARGLGLNISYQEIQVTGSAMVESYNSVCDQVETHRKLATLAEWQVFMPWVLPFLRSGDKVHLGYERNQFCNLKQKDIGILLKTYTSIVGWYKDPTITIPVMSYSQFIPMCKALHIQRNCVSSCDTSLTSRDCGTCDKCRVVEKCLNY